MPNFDTNQNTKLVVRKRSGEVMLEIENFVGVGTCINCAAGGEIILETEPYVISRTTLEFIENKPILTIYVYE